MDEEEFRNKYSDHLDQIADRVNSDPNSTWKAKKYNRWHGKTRKEIQEMNQTFRMDQNFPNGQFPEEGFFMPTKSEFNISDDELPAS